MGMMNFRSSLLNLWVIFSKTSPVTWTTTVSFFYLKKKKALFRLSSQREQT